MTETAAVAQASALVVGGEGLDGDGEEEHLERDQDDHVDDHRRRRSGGVSGRPHGWYPRAQMVSSRISTSIRPSGRGGGPEITAPVRDLEVAFVAGAVPPVLVGFEVDDAAEVGALLAERHHVAVGEAEQDRRVVIGRVAEQVGEPTATSASGISGRGSPVFTVRNWVHAARPRLPAAITPAPATR